MLTPPTLAEVSRHEATHGGVWRLVPPPRNGEQPRPRYVRLTVAQGAAGPFIRWEAGASLDEVLADDDNRALRHATWIPCDARGERIV